MLEQSSPLWYDCLATISIDQKFGFSKSFIPFFRKTKNSGYGGVICLDWPVFPTTKKSAERQNIAYSIEENRNAFFPKMLRKLRENAGISQLELSKQLGVSKSTIGLYENGDTLPDAKTLRDIAKFYHISADALLGLSITGSTDSEMQIICNKLRITEKAVNSIVDLCASPKYAFSFMCLVESVEFKEIIHSLAGYLSIHWENEKVSPIELLILDEQVREKTGGALCVVPAWREKRAILVNMQETLSAAVKRIDLETSSPKKNREEQGTTAPDAPEGAKGGE